jgi:hypothetical protein
MNLPSRQKICYKTLYSYVTDAIVKRRTYCTHSSHVTIGSAQDGPNISQPSPNVHLIIEVFLSGPYVQS